MPKVNTTVEDLKNKTHPMVSFLSNLTDSFGGTVTFEGNREASDTDKRRAIMSALKNEGSSKYDAYEIVAVFDSYFVYAKDYEGNLMKRDFTVSDEGPVTLGEDVQEVIPVTDFVSVNNKEDQMTTNKSRVDELIANTATQFTEDDRAWLSELPEDRLNKLTPSESEPVSDKEEQEPTANAVSDTEDEQSAAEEPKANATVDEYIAGAPVEMQEVLKEGLRLQKAQRAKLIKEITACKRNAFTEAQLKAMSTEQLEAMAKLAETPSYEGSAGEPRTNASEQGDSNEAPAAPKAFVRKTNS